MEAQKMFEKLEYNECEKTDYYSWWYKNTKENKSIGFNFDEDYIVVEDGEESVTLSLDELRAIIQECNEFNRHNNRGMKSVFEDGDLDGIMDKKSR